MAFELGLEGLAILELMLGMAALWEESRRAQSQAGLGNIGAHTWLVCVAVRRENVGQKARG